MERLAATLHEEYKTSVVCEIVQSDTIVKIIWRNELFQAEDSIVDIKSQILNKHWGM